MGPIARFFILGSLLAVLPLSVAQAQFFGTPSLINKNTTAVHLNLTQKGEVLLGETRLNTVVRLSGAELEVRVPVVRSPGFVLDRLAIQLSVPASLTLTSAASVRAVVIDEHGVGETSVELSGPHELTYQVVGIGPQANVTIVAVFPKSAFTISPLTRVLSASLGVWVGASVLVLVLTIVILALALARRARVSNIKGSKRILPSPPMNLAPAVAGVVIDGKVGARELAATLVDLANRGFLYVSRRGNDFAFAKRRSFEIEGPVKALSDVPVPGSSVMPVPRFTHAVNISDYSHRLVEPQVGTSTDLKNFERALLSKLFLPDSFRVSRQDIDLRVGRHIFSRKIAQVYWEMYQEATNLGYFEENPSRVHLRYRMLGLGLFFVGIAGLIFGVFIPDPKYPLFLWAATLIAAAITIGVSRSMNVHTRAGRAAVESWWGFRNFLTDETPIAYTPDAPELFTRYLPYAIAFGVEAEWAQRFLKTAFRPPEWFSTSEEVITLENFVGAMFPIVRSVADVFNEAKEPIVE